MSKFFGKIAYGPRYSNTDYWTQESIKRIFNSGLFWAVGAAEKKAKRHNCATLEGTMVFGGSEIWLKILEIFCTKTCQFIRQKSDKNGPQLIRIVPL